MAVNKKRNKWQVRVRDPHGRWYEAKTFDRKVDAERHERLLIENRDRGQPATDVCMRELSVNDFFTLWMKECRGSISDGWKMTQHQIFRDHVTPYIGEAKFTQLRKRDMELLMNKLIEKGLGPQSRVHVYNLLNKMFGDAVHHFELVSMNPVSPKLKPRVPRRERNFLTPENAWKLLNSVRGNWLGPAIWVSTLAALRPCETQALKWDAIDLTEGRLLIKSAYNRKEQRLQDHPKQDDWGTAPVPKVLAEYLAELKAKSKSDFVAPGPDGKTMLNYDSYYQGLKRLCRELGLVEVTPHELRHSATEIWVEAGASLEDLRRLLNHSSSKVTGLYVHRTEERLKRISQQIGSPEPVLKLVQ